MNIGNRNNAIFATIHSKGIVISMCSQMSMRMFMCMCPKDADSNVRDISCD